MVSIFANGNLEEGNEWIRPFLTESTAIIAADGGSHHLHALNHPPNIVIGDMDSLPDEVHGWLTAVNTQFITHPPVKNETDLELALHYTAKHYDDDILLFAALGGRLDQMFGNVHLLTRLLDGALSKYTGRRNDLCTVTNFNTCWQITTGSSRGSCLSL